MIGNRTRRAIKQFQKQQSIRIDGEPSKKVTQ
ncbi:hypothetical protein DO021_16615 [Desulfobacter hydrogenophilus]|uniref:Peptidoglycan binding-like domain-containing protein n=1 Tax=Desulfobacter hydrogenophilus TaxID=2291 RepID=A0A328FCX4_9BACT|nr:peptidoglycan-binding protein [Desulfobacter hydrogenophilus]QBH15643.1 hypothetical protein EYB58_18370 [Desulfobacter hydrogenophilus]RAM00915.1 hypothetical protein DO021_16615 [Desulfobacter hydrogenophilus]